MTFCFPDYTVLIDVDATPKVPEHKEFLEKVSKAIGLIQYRQFRKDWLSYQKCNIDVVAFCKKTKLTFRGDK